MLPLAREGGGEIVCTCEHVRMLRSQHALSYGEHLALDSDLLRLSMLRLAREGEGEIASGRTLECCWMRPVPDQNAVHLALDLLRLTVLPFGIQALRLPVPQAGARRMLLPLGAHPSPRPRR